MKSVHSYEDLLEAGMADDDYVNVCAEAMKPRQVLEVVKSSMVQGKTPDISSPGIRDLTHEINKIQYHFHIYSTEWGPSLRAASDLSAALDVILSVCPTICDQFQSALGEAEGIAEPEQVTRLKNALRLLKSLHSISGEVLGMHFLTNGRVKDLPPQPEWEHIARRLCGAFHVALDGINEPKGASKQAGYTFASKIVSLITKQNITTQSVETLIKRNRDVNGGRNFFHLPQGETPKILPP